MPSLCGFHMIPLDLILNFYHFLTLFDVLAVHVLYVACWDWLFPPILHLSAISLATIHSWSFPSWHLEGELWPIRVSLIVLTVCCWWGNAFPWVWSMLKCPSISQIISWSVFTGIHQMLWWCWIYAWSYTLWVCQSLSPIWYRSVFCSHHCYGQLSHHEFTVPSLPIGLLL